MTIDSKYGVPTVAIHTNIFERAVRSVARVNGIPRARAVFVPQPQYIARLRLPCQQSIESVVHAFVTEVTQKRIASTQR